MRARAPDGSMHAPRKPAHEMSLVSATVATRSLYNCATTTRRLAAHFARALPPDASRDTGWWAPHCMHAPSFRAMSFAGVGARASQANVVK